MTQTANLSLKYAITVGFSSFAVFKSANSQLRERLNVNFFEKLTPVKYDKFWVSLSSEIGYRAVLVIGPDYISL